MSERLTCLGPVYIHAQRIAEHAISCRDLAVVRSVRRLVECFVMYFDLRLVFP